MKNILLILSLFASSTAMANPFDSFAGDYTVVGSSTAVPSGQFTSCYRFNFQYLTGFSVTIDTSGYHQSDMVYFKTTGGDSVTGSSGQPISDYNDSIFPPVAVGGNEAVTTGDSNDAQNVWTQWQGANAEALTISIKREGSQFVLGMIESLTENSSLVASCTYQAVLVKN